MLPGAMSRRHGPKGALATLRAFASIVAKPSDAEPPPRGDRGTPGRAEASAPTFSVGTKDTAQPPQPAPVSREPSAPCALKEKKARRA